MRQFIVLTGLIFSTLIIYGQISADSIRNYYDTIAKHRTGRNIRLLYSESSPLTPEQMRSFTGLNYFPPAFAYIAEARLEIFTEKESVFLATTTDRLPEYIRYGKVIFTLDTMELSLIAFQNKKLQDVKQDDDYLFIPFKDATNGNETYETGRYVDVQIPENGDAVIIDFNKAYNPYCAYNPRFSCVIPPEENRLPVRIEAGEKQFK